MYKFYQTYRLLLTGKVLQNDLLTEIISPLITMDHSGINIFTKSNFNKNLNFTML